MPPCRHATMLIASPPVRQSASPPWSSGARLAPLPQPTCHLQRLGTSHATMPPCHQATYLRPSAILTTSQQNSSQSQSQSQSLGTAAAVRCQWLDALLGPRPITPSKLNTQYITNDFSNINSFALHPPVLYPPASQSNLCTCCLLRPGWLAGWLVVVSRQR